MGTENRLTAIRAKRVGDWVRMEKGLSKENKDSWTQTKYGDYWREKGVERGRSL